MIRNILAVVAGWLSWGIICNLLLFPILMSLFPDQFENTVPTTKAIMASLVLTFICSIIAGYVSGLVAATNHLRVVQIAAIINLVFAIVVQISFGDTMPAWYHIIFLASIMPLMIMGGKEGIKRL